MELEAGGLTHMRGLCLWHCCPAAPGPELARLSWVLVPLLAFSWDHFIPRPFRPYSWDFFGQGGLGGPSCPASAGERMGMGLGKVKGHDCPLPSHPRILEAVSAPTKGHSELPPGHAPDPRGKPRCWLRLLKVDDTCFSCGQSSGSGW